MKYHFELLQARHGFNSSEVNKLHLTTMLISLGSGLVAVFIPVYLMDLGYSITWVASFFLAVQILIFIGDIISGELTARFGPKHIMRLSLFFRAATLISLFMLDHYINIVYILPFFMAGERMFFVPYNTEFSKLSEVSKDVSGSEGRQLSRYYAITKMAAALGPLIGGLLITTFDSLAINLSVAIVIVIIAGAILNGHEPVKTHQKTKVRRLSYSKIKPDIMGAVAISFGFVASGIFYGIYVKEFIVTGHESYGFIGLITSVSFVFAAVFSLFIGRYSDRKYSQAIVVASTILSSVTSFSRGLTVQPVASASINAVSGTADVGLRIPFFKGVFNSVNKLEGYRISYFIKMFMVMDGLRALFWLLFIILYSTLEGRMAFQIMFGLSGLIALLMLRTKELYAKE